MPTRACKRALGGAHGLVSTWAHQSQAAEVGKVVTRNHQSAQAEHKKAHKKAQGRLATARPPFLLFVARKFDNGGIVPSSQPTRRLILLRHGESGWEGDPPSDHERTLTALGAAQARMAAQALVHRGWVPQRILSSSARRAHDTAELVAHAAGVAVERHQALYSGGLGVLQSCVAALADDVEVVLVVGHNPALSAAASTLCGSAVSLSTGCAALLEKTLLETHAPTWADAIHDPGWRLAALLTPES